MKNQVKILLIDAEGTQMNLAAQLAGLGYESVVTVNGWEAAMQAITDSTYDVVFVANDLADPSECDRLSALMQHNESLYWILITPVAIPERMKWAIQQGVHGFLLSNSHPLMPTKLRHELEKYFLLKKAERASVLS